MRVRVSLMAAILAAFAATPRASLCQNLDKKFTNSIVMVKYRVDATRESIGSGFLIFHPVSAGQSEPTKSYWLYLVTNKHVLPPEGGAHEIMLRVAVRHENRTVEVKDIPVPVLGPDGKYLNTIGLHPDRLTDVAVVRVGRELLQARANFLYEVLESQTALTTDLLLPREEFNNLEIGIGTEVYLVGYPNGVYDSRNASPILRVGIISTEPDKDFAFNEELQAKYDLPPQLSGFLIDANVFPGSSGSMVFRRTNIIPGLSVGGKRSTPYVVGIISKSIPIEDFGHTQRMGLGVAYSADTILETIKLVSARY